MKYPVLISALLSASVLAASQNPASKPADSSVKPASSQPKDKPTSAPKGSKKPGAKPQIVTLKLLTSEQRIRGGKLETLTLAASYPLPKKAVLRSRKYGKISSALEPELGKLFNRLGKREPRSAYFSNVKGNWIAQQQTGWKVDAKKTRDNLLEALKNGDSEAKIVLELTPPKRSVKDFADRGILFHFGGGQSSFAGSPTFRVKNILVGANKIDQRYIEAGDEFNFGAYVGDIDKKNGFVKGLIISGGTLALEDGGGICQVSTTIFRAAYLSGLPITERHEHSHVVHYYDPIGLEATVYTPEKNFKFKNDTAKALFIQADYDAKKQTLRFDLFGVKPDRKVTVSKPALSDYKPATKATYSADPSVRLGRSRRIDVAERGVTVNIRRRVVLAAGEVRKDTLKSVYKPWGEVFAVSPQDPRAQQSTP